MANERISNSEQAIERAIKLTGLGQLTREPPVARRAKIERSNTPFLWRALIGREVWHVDFDKVSLRLKTAAPGFKDPYERHFTVVLDADTAQCLNISSSAGVPDPDMLPEPPADAAEAQLRGEQEIYHSIPAEEPKITFLEALENILAKGIGSPFLAKEIDGLYVMESKLGSELRPAWIITMRGLPPRPVHRAGVYVPEWQRNHMRDVVDARSGTVLFATNSPQPVEPR